MRTNRESRTAIYPTRTLRHNRDLSAFLGTQASEMQVTALKDRKRCGDTNESTTGGRDG
jgi:hypothetical protein